MRRLVYLFELDSVRNSEKEVEIGQKALFEEITVLGHDVVISLNQLGDSKVFMSIVNDKKTYDNIFKLFEAGAIKVSLFNELNSVSEYVQKKLEEPNFIFSNLPLKIGGRNLKEEIKDALKYSSLRVLQKLRDDKENEPYKEQFEYLIRYISLILFISTNSTICIESKSKTEYKEMVDFIGILMKPENIGLLKSKFNKLKIKYEQFDEAMKELEAVQKKLTSEELISRSEWFNPIKTRGETDTQELALAILNLCYNYSVESSIIGVTPHYTEGAEFEFIDDFICRLNNYWELHKEGGHTFRQKSTENCFNVTVSTCSEPWENAVRIITLPEIGIFRKKKSKTEIAVTKPIVSKSYEIAYCEDKKHWNRKLIKNIIKRIVTSVLCASIFYGYNKLTGCLNLEDLGFIAEISLGMVYSVVISFIAQVLRIPDILESFKYLCWTVKDALMLFFKAPRNIAYKNEARIKGSKR